jgi:hypothetical protein
MNSQSMFDDPGGIAALVVLVVVAGLMTWGVGWLAVTYRYARGLILAGAVAVGVLLGRSVLRTSSGYLAGLLYGQALFLMSLPVFASCIVAAIPRTRRFGLVSLIAAGVMVAGFFGTYLGGYYLGLHAWAHDGPVPRQ